MKGLFDQAFHNHWLNIIKKLRGVKSVMHVKTATTPPQFFINVTVAVENKKEIIRYRLDSEPSIEIEEQYLFIVNDLKKKGYGTK